MSIGGALPWQPGRTGLPAGTGYLWHGEQRLRELNAQIMAARPRGAAAERFPGVPDHGTEAGYQRHRRLGEKACQACLEGARAADTARERAKGIRTKSEAAKERAARPGGMRVNER